MSTDSIGRVSTHVVDGVSIVAIHGKLTKGSPNCGLFNASIDELLGEGDQEIVIDMCEVTQLDDFGLAEFAAGWTRACQLGSAVAVANPSRAVEGFFSGLICDFLAQTYESVESAVEALKQNPTA